MSVCKEGVCDDCDGADTNHDRMLEARVRDLESALESGRRVIENTRADIWEREADEAFLAAIDRVMPPRTPPASVSTEDQPQEPRGSRPDKTTTGNGQGLCGVAGQPGDSEVGAGVDAPSEAPVPANLPRPSDADPVAVMDEWYAEVKRRRTKEAKAERAWCSTCNEPQDNWGPDWPHKCRPRPNEASRKLCNGCGDDVTEKTAAVMCLPCSIRFHESTTPRTDSPVVPELTPASVKKDGARMHYLKTWPLPFADVRSGAKPFEFRKHDRDYRVGDVLVLEEWDPNERRFTHEAISREVTYLLPGGTFGVPDGYCVMGIKPWQRTEPPLSPLRKWAEQRIEACRAEERKFSDAWPESKGKGPPQALVEAWTERRTMQQLLDRLDEVKP